MGFTTVLFIVALTACSSPQQVATPPATRPRIVAHRGASYEAPENTLAAFRRAWELGVECVELDMHVTRDGAVVVIHDDTTRRIGGVDRAVSDQTLAELRALDMGQGERIPTIAEALATIPEGRTMFVEIKTGPATAPAIARAIRAAPHRGHIALQGFDPEALAALAAELPEAPAFLDLAPPVENDRPLTYPATALDVAVGRFAGVALLHESVDAGLLAAARSAGLLVDVWTINDAGLLAAWLGEDVRWVETDRPELASGSP